jgi:hypothetical protein
MCAEHKCSRSRPRFRSPWPGNGTLAKSPRPSTPQTRCCLASTRDGVYRDRGRFPTACVRVGVLAAQARWPTSLGGVRCSRRQRRAASQHASNGSLRTAFRACGDRNATASQLADAWAAWAAWAEGSVVDVARGASALHSSPTLAFGAALRPSARDVREGGREGLEHVRRAGAIRFLRGVSW